MSEPMQIACTVLVCLLFIPQLVILASVIVDAYRVWARIFRGHR